jgi:hypothetical protein
MTHQLSLLSQQGGSITSGWTLASRNEAWPNWLQLLLSDRFPCDGGDHVVTNAAKRAEGTDYWLSSLGTNRTLYHEVRTADLVIVESAVNDVLNTRSVNRNTELLIRYFDKMNRNKAMLWVTAGWRGFTVDAAPPYHLDVEENHAMVLRYYDIPHVSLQASLWPFHSVSMRLWEEQALFNDRICHISQLGHKMVAQLLLHFFESEVNALSVVRDPIHTLPANISDAAAMWSSLADLDKLSLSPLLSLRFDSPILEPWLVGKLPVWKGWLYLEDRVGKPGLVAQGGPSSSSPILVDFSTNRSVIYISVGALNSYQHMGRIQARLLSGRDHPQTLTTAIWDCLWKEKVSIEHTNYITYNRKQGEADDYTLEISTSPAPRKEQKTKLLGILVQ